MDRKLVVPYSLGRSTLIVAWECGVVLEQVSAYVDGRMFTFNMWGTQGDFDSYLPVFDNIVASFNAPAASSSTLTH